MITEKKKFKNKVLIEVIKITIILASTIVICFLLIQKIKTETANLIDKKLMVKMPTAQIEERLRLTNEYKVAEPYLDQVNKFLLKEENISKINPSLEELAQNTNNKDAGIETKNPTSYTFSGGEAEKIKKMITVSGNYNTFLEYLEKFRELPFFMVIESINITGASDLNKNAKMVCGISLFLEK